MKKSQVSTEFMFFVGAAFVLLVAYLIISYNYLNLTFKRRDIMSSLNLLEEIRNEINLASRVENGYYRIITLPNKINKQDYALSLGNRELNINFNGIDYARLLSTSVSLDKNNAGGLFFLPGDKIFITKINNVVYVDKTCNTGDPNICSFAYPKDCATTSCILTCTNNVWVYKQSSCPVSGQVCNKDTRHCSAST